MQAKPIPRRPRLTLKILFYAIVDVAGIAMFAAGALWLTQGSIPFVAGFPADRMQAIAATGGGILLMFWAATQILRQMIRRPADPTGGTGR